MLSKNKLIEKIIKFNSVTHNHSKQQNISILFRKFDLGVDIL